MSASQIEDAKKKLLEMRTQWESRLSAIQSDRRRGKGALEADFAEQAVQRENDEVLDGLDVTGRHELEGIEAALARIEAGTWGSCARCGESIAEGRLEAMPAAVACHGCATGAE